MGTLTNIYHLFWELYPGGEWVNNKVPMIKQKLISPKFSLRTRELLGLLTEHRCGASDRGMGITKAALLGSLHPAWLMASSYLCGWSPWSLSYTLYVLAPLPHCEAPCNQDSIACNWLEGWLGTQVRLPWPSLPPPSIKEHQQLIKTAVTIFFMQTQPVLWRWQLFGLENNAVQCHLNKRKMNPKYTPKIIRWISMTCAYAVKLYSFVSLQVNLI